MSALSAFVLLFSLLLGLAALALWRLRQRLRQQQRRLDGLLWQLEQLGEHDTLTGLGNLQHLLQRLQQALGSPRGGTFSLLLLELQVPPGGASQTLIHAAALRLSGELRADDYLARVAEWRFAIISRLPSEAQIEPVLQRLRQVLQQPYREVGVAALTVHGSYSLAPEHGRQAYRLLRHAEAGLPGRSSRISRYDPGHDWGHALRQALPEDQLLLQFQPCWWLSERRVCGLALQLSWLHPQQGVLAHAELCALADELECRAALLNWTLEQLPATLPLLRQALPAASVLSLEVPLRLLGEASLGTALSQLRLAAAPLQLELCLRGDLLAEGLSGRVRGLLELHQQGIALWLDDLPGSHLPLQALTQLPFSGLRLGAQPSGELRAACLMLALQLGWQVRAVAVPVDDLPALQQLGCQQVQVDAWCRPLTVPALLAWLAEQ